jgi:Zn-dependent protease with chaperone function
VEPRTANPQAGPPPFRFGATPRPSNRILSYWLPPAKLAQAIALARVRNLLAFLSPLLTMAALGMLLATGASARLARWAAGISPRRFVQGLVFLPVFLAFLWLVDLLPEAIGHAQSLRYGISVQPWGPWLLDRLKTLALTLFFGTLLLQLLGWLLARAPRTYWLWFWAASVPLLMLSVFVVPVLIEPLFEHFEPLGRTNPALVARLESVVKRTGMEIPPERMYRMRASEKTHALNAYVTGIGSTRRVVLWDTAIARLTPDEILFVFGHEAGHYVLGHITQGIVFTVALLFALLWLGSRLVRRALARFSAAWGIGGLGDWAVVPLLALVLAGLEFLAQPVENTFSRYLEHQADVYGQGVITGLVADPQLTAAEAFNVLGEVTLDDPDPSRLIEFWTYSHPSLKSRVRWAATHDLRPGPGWEAEGAATGPPA